VGRSNNHRRYAVSIIDCFPKYVWLLPITQKKAEKVLEVLGPFSRTTHPSYSRVTMAASSPMPAMKELLEDLNIKH